MSTYDLLKNINREDKTVASAVEKEITKIEKLVEVVFEKLKIGGRLFYIGAGTSGRLGILDASECPPTFGVDHGLVIGLIAGGDAAIRKAVENAEDDFDQAWKDLSKYSLDENDVIIGIAASGRTPYVIGGLRNAKERGLITGCVVCNPESAVANVSDYPIEVVVGPEFVTGSTRMKAGTAQKLVLNMITTAVMIKMGKVKGNRMVDMQLSNEKLIERGKRMIMAEIGVNELEAEKLLLEYGSVRKVIDNFNKGYR